MDEDFGPWISSHECGVGKGWDGKDCLKACAYCSVFYCGGNCDYRR